MEKNMFESLGKDILKAAAVLLAAGGEVDIQSVPELNTYAVAGIKHPSQCGISFPTGDEWRGEKMELTQKLMQSLIKACL